jgi:hypothetical protein
MEFLGVNLVNTTTQLAVSSNTALAANVFTRDKFSQFYTSGFANDLTSSSLTVTFDTTTPVSRIILQDMNFKEFYFFYNGATANSFALTGGDTSASSYTANADLNKYFRFSTVQCSSITIVAKKTIVADQEKLLGLLTISDLTVALEKIPSANAYKPSNTPKQIVHTLSDGGTRIHNVRAKWTTTINLEYVTQAQRDSLFDLHAGGEAFTFCPFGTATGWDAISFEAVWPGPFQLFAYSDNAASSGFSGKVDLKETPT